MKIGIVLACLTFAVAAAAHDGRPNGRPAAVRPELSRHGGGGVLLVADHDKHHQDDHHGGHSDPRRGWGPRPGWHSSWRYPKSYHPHWWSATVSFPGFVWLSVNPGV